MSQRQLAKAMNMPPNTISEIFQGRKSVTSKTAIELEEVLGIAARKWLHAEADYRLALERQRRQAGDRG
jgi:addiction module HigA family antidote